MLQKIKELIGIITKKKTPLWWLMYARLLASIIIVAVYVLWQEKVVYPINELSYFTHSMFSALINHEGWLSKGSVVWILLVGLLILGLSGSLARIFTAFIHRRDVDETYATAWARWNTFFDFVEIAYTLYYLFIACVFCSSWVLHRDLFLVEHNIECMVIFAGFHIALYVLLRIYSSELTRCKKACR